MNTLTLIGTAPLRVFVRRGCFVGALAFLAVTVIPVCVIASPAVSDTTAPALAHESPVHRHMREIADKLRCLVCQGETVAVSNSDLAQDMRQKIIELLKKGKSDKQIFDYFVARYGNFILYRPPVMSSTWVLWFGPPIVLVLGLVVMLVYLRSRARRMTSNTLSQEDAERAHALLDKAEESHRW